jgi:hypothetical protein
MSSCVCSVAQTNQILLSNTGVIPICLNNAQIKELKFIHVIKKIVLNEDLNRT